MTDPTSTAGDPVEEPRTGDADVVERAKEALAEAEAARRDAAVPDTQAQPVVVAEPATSDTPDDEVPWYDRPDDVPFDPEPATVAAEAVAVEPAVVDPEPRVTASEPTPEPGYAAAGLVAASAQPIFVQAPEPPRPRGNRGAAGAIGLVATLAFAVVYFGAILAVALISGGETVSGLGALALRLLGTWAFWVPVVVFFLAFWILGAFINRARWGHWVVWGLLVGVASYGGYLLGQLFQAPFWTLTGTQGSELLEVQVLAPLAIVTFVLGRELTIWFGAWVARRGRRVTELNAESLREYERTLEAGPQLHHV